MFSFFRFNMFQLIRKSLLITFLNSIALEEGLCLVVVFFFFGYKNMMKKVKPYIILQIWKQHVIGSYQSRGFQQESKHWSPRPSLPSERMREFPAVKAKPGSWAQEQTLGHGRMSLDVSCISCFAKNHFLCIFCISASFLSFIASPQSSYP